jgi:hypothetical protein
LRNRSPACSTRSRVESTLSAEIVIDGGAPGAARTVTSGVVMRFKVFMVCRFFSRPHIDQLPDDQVAPVPQACGLPRARARRSV